MLDSARRDIKSLEERVGAQELVVREEANGGREAQLETERSLEWLHDSESSFQSELHGIRKRLDDIEENLGKLEIAVNEIQDYSYAFNIKILGVPELKANEDASETSNLCVNLFNHMGTITLLLTTSISLTESLFVTLLAPTPNQSFANS